MNGYCLLPDMLTRDDVLRLNEQLQSSAGMVVPGGSLFPHLTVIQTELEPGFDWVAGLDQLKGSRFLQHEPVAWLGSEINVQRSGLVYWNLRVVPPWLIGLNELAVEVVERWVVHPERPEVSATWDVDQEASFRRTGVPYNLGAYVPHFTVGLVDDDTRSSSSGGWFAQPVTRRLVKFRSLAYTEHGDHGQILKVLESVPLALSWD